MFVAIIMINYIWVKLFFKILDNSNKIQLHGNIENDSKMKQKVESSQIER
jgi:hypothetical protein